MLFPSPVPNPVVWNVHIKQAVEGLCVKNRIAINMTKTLPVLALIATNLIFSGFGFIMFELSR